MQDSVQCLDPSFSTIQTVPLAAWPRHVPGVWAGERPPGRPLPAVFSHLPAFLDSSCLHIHLLSSQHISAAFFTVLSLALRFSVSNQFMSALRTSKHVFKEFRDNGCFLVFHHCFRFLKIFSTMFRTPESEKFHLGVENPLSLHLLEERDLNK